MFSNEEIKKFIETDFQVLPTNLSPSEAITQLGSAKYGIVVNEMNQPIFLIEQRDLEQFSGVQAIDLTKIKLPPSPILNLRENEEGFTPEDLAKTIQECQDRGAKGVVVVTDSNIIGYLGKTAENFVLNYFKSPLDSVIYSSPGSYPNRSYQDIQLAGSIDLLPGTPVPVALIEITCAECGWVNKLDYFLEDEPLICQNKNYREHKLRKN